MADKDPLELFIYKKTGGLYDPRIVKTFIDCLEEWLPGQVRATHPDERDYYAGYNNYKGEIIENLRIPKNFYYQPPN